MERQINFTDIEYGKRRRQTKREEFLKCMNEITPWEKIVEMIKPHYYKNKRGKKSCGIGKYLLQIWYNLSDEAVEDSINDSYTM